jgi:hypothetical protein
MVKFCLIFSIAFLFVCQNPFAQTNRLFVEFNGGMSFMNNVPLHAIRDMTVVGLEATQPITHRPSIHVNLLLGYQLNKKWSVKTGVAYQNRVFDVGTNPFAFGLPNKISLRFITVPTTLQYNFYNDNKVQFYASGGVSVRYRTHRNENKELISFQPGRESKNIDGLNEIKARNTAMLYGYNSRSSSQPILPDSFVYVSAVFYELPNVEWFAHIGTGLNVNLTERLAITYGLTYNFQLAKNSSFGRYNYSESYQNGAFFGKGERLERSAFFRDNFFTMSAGFIYKF